MRINLDIFWIYDEQASLWMILLSCFILMIKKFTAHQQKVRFWPTLYITFNDKKTTGHKEPNLDHLYVPTTNKKDRNRVKVTKVHKTQNNNNKIHLYAYMFFTFNLAAAAYNYLWNSLYVELASDLGYLSSCQAAFLYCRPAISRLIPSSSFLPLTSSIRSFNDVFKFNYELMKPLVISVCACILLLLLIYKWQHHRPITIKLWSWLCVRVVPKTCWWMLEISSLKTK